MNAADQFPEDEQLRESVMQELAWEPEVSIAEIGATVSEGIVTLTGYADTWMARHTAEQTALRVYGVRGVANEIRVKPFSQLTDTAIAKNAAHALETNVRVPAGQIRVIVSDGLLTLSGTVDRAWQKEAATAAVRTLLGVTGVSSEIEINPRPATATQREAIEAALGRNALLMGNRIFVETREGVVSLSGHARSWHERAEAERIAAAAPGVTAVENHILIAP
ncbi:MAG: BON domain-containing protein [Blastocatellia bacterium]